MNETPAKVLLRLREVCAWLGIAEQEFLKCVRAGLIPYVQIKKNGRKYYRTSDIKKIFVDNVRMGRE